MRSDEAQSATQNIAKPWPPEASEGNAAGARAILAAWQNSSFRGWTVAEKRLDRARIVQTLISQLREEDLTVRGLILAADEIACGRWRRLLNVDTDTPTDWEVLTPKAVLVEDHRVRADCVVVADELEAYLTADLAAAITGSRAILGLCASPRALGNMPHLRKYIGRALDAAHTNTTLEMHHLSVAREVPHEQAEEEDPDDAREQLLTTKDPQNLFNQYLTEIQKLPLLTADEEIELGKQIEVGLYVEHLIAELSARGGKITATQHRAMSSMYHDGKRAKERFLGANLRLVVSIAKRYYSRFELMDAIQEGNLGLIRAVEKFDYRKGYKFSTYATWWIRQAITRAIADQTHLVRIPVHQFESDSLVITEWRRQSREAANPSAADIASELGLDTTDVEAVLGRHRSPYSLDLMFERGFDLAEADALDESYEALVVSLKQDQLQSVLETLSEREAGVIRLRFGLTDGQPHTLDEIGSVYGVTRERIRQIEAKTMGKLRHPFRSECLRDYFEETFNPDIVTDDSAV